MLNERKLKSRELFQALIAYTLNCQQ